MPGFVPGATRASLLKLRRQNPMLPIPDERFTRASRLTDAAQYRRVFAKNKRSADRNWTILYSHNQGQPARLGMAVAKKCAKRAVDRNRLKRLARESFRQHKQSLSGFDIVLLARNPSVTASKKDLAVSLARHWARIAKDA